jgi:hypothetical protein
MSVTSESNSVAASADRDAVTTTGGTVRPWAMAWEQASATLKAAQAAPS